MDAFGVTFGSSSLHFAFAGLAHGELGKLHDFTCQRYVLHMSNNSRLHMTTFPVGPFHEPESCLRTVVRLRWCHCWLWQDL